jgi:hypothetical protein
MDNVNLDLRELRCENGMRMKLAQVPITHRDNLSSVLIIQIRLAKGYHKLKYSEKHRT